MSLRLVKTTSNLYDILEHNAMWRRRGEAAFLGYNAGAGFTLFTAGTENKHLTEKMTKFKIMKLKHTKINLFHGYPLSSACTKLLDLSSKSSSWRVSSPSSYLVLLK